MGALAEGVFGGAGGAISRQAAEAPGQAEQDRFRRGMEALDRAPDVDTAIQAAAAAVEAPAPVTAAEADFSGSKIP